MSTMKPVMGIPLDACDVHTPSPRAEQYLQSLGLPTGVASEFKKTLEQFPSRTWIIDNSGSMATNDGHRLVAGQGGKSVEISSSRWEELADAIQWHGSLASELSAPTEFRLLNPPGHGVPQTLVCGQGCAPPEAEIGAIKRLCATQPTGRTPICQQIRAVTASIAQRADALRAAGQRHVVIIASDGVSTDGDIAEALRPLQNLPVWLVVRLCTDEESVAAYWNKVDEELELDLDVLDDLSGEAKEVVGFSPWLTYGLPLHRLREWGCMNKVFDLLDEKALSPSEMRELLVMLLGEQDLPHPEADYRGFQKATEQALAKMPTVYDPVRKQRQPWVDMKRLRRKYDPDVCCTIA
mmetsp:Transcript_25800/g.68958  ORF Transcript_25800/g.68958 Transcript_25800/m.68958 type:complete len:352 (-) Transcript_25800:125-1180(-)